LCNISKDHGILQLHGIVGQTLTFLTYESSCVPLHFVKHYHQLDLFNEMILKLKRVLFRC